MRDDDTTERWLPVPGFLGYEISDRGRIWTHKQGASRPMKVVVGSLGYCVVSLYRGSTRRQIKVHRLVLEAFVGPCPEGHEAAHLDGVKVHNVLENLAWVTPKENQGHRRAHGTDPCGVRNGRSKLTPTHVADLRALRQSGVMPTELARRFGVAREHIYKVLSRGAWKDV